MTPQEHARSVVTAARALAAAQRALIESERALIEAERVLRLTLNRHDRLTKSRTKTPETGK